MKYKLVNWASIKAELDLAHKVHMILVQRVDKVQKDATLTADELQRAKDSVELYKNLYYSEGEAVSALKNTIEELELNRLLSAFTGFAIGICTGLGILLWAALRGVL